MLGVFAWSLTSGVEGVRAAGDPLLEVLIRKGVLTPEEASQIRKEANELEKERDKRVDKKVTEVEQKVNSQVDQKVATVEKQVEKKAADWKLPEALKGLKVGVLAYVDYSAGARPIFMGPPLYTSAGKVGRNVSGHTGYNQWTLQRGYLNIEKEITPWLHARYTPDLTQDSTGDWKFRQKYLYAELRPPNAGKVLTQMKGEIGLGHIPWLDFEEHINPYRAQGTMPIERAGVFNSADLGVNIRGNFGGRLADAKQIVGNDHYDGRYGSWHIGVYNGAGYHATEVNENKPVEYRFTVRPLPDYLPGFQATYFGLYGKGNNTSASSFTTTANPSGTPFYNYSPDWIIHEGFLSYQHPWFTLIAQMFASKGNQGGNWTTTPGIPGLPIGRRANSLWTQGYSVFADVKIPIKILNENRLHAFYRTDWFNADQDHVIARSAKYTKLITGTAFQVYKNNLILLAFEKTWYGQDYAIQGGTGYNGTGSRVVAPGTNGSNLGTDQRIQTVYQISY
ncbi:MAG: hypothetical protein COS90_01375 [Deltaproteobacteria bacterium CG07_land_8_20_14_0_80_60_11]|nr:MAG: hypothetical protein COS90_01375 [Deltaproteobacteria bacterium CG07_land_8_20_14_0_80_60_11]